MRKISLFLILLLCVVRGAKADIGEALDRSGWTVSVSSWHSDGQSGITEGNAIKDGDLGTYWHNNWGGDGAKGGSVPSSQNLVDEPEFFIIDLGEPKTIGGFGYIPRSDASGDWIANGALTSFKVYVSASPFNITTPCSSQEVKKAALETNLGMTPTLTCDMGGKWTKNPNSSADEQTFATTEPVTGQYVLVVCTGSVGHDDGSDNKWTNCAEFYVYEFTPPPYETVLDDMDATKTGSNSGNHFTSITLNEKTITIPSDKYDNIYKSFTNDWDNVFHVTSGETYNITHTGNWKSALHGYAFVDFDNDGEFNAAGSNGTVTLDEDILAYTQYGGKRWGRGGDNPETVSGLVGRLNYQGGVFPDFQMRANMAPGFYRMRINSAWDDISPAGKTTDGSDIIDFRLHVQGVNATLSATGNYCTVMQGDGTTDLPSTITTGESYDIKVVPSSGYAFHKMTIKYGYITDPVNPDYLGDMPNWTTMEVYGEDLNEDGTYTLSADITKYGEIEIAAECEPDGSIFEVTVNHIYRTAAGDKVLLTESHNVAVGDVFHADQSVFSSDFLHFVGETTLTVEANVTEYTFYIEEQNIPFKTSASFETAKWQALHSSSDQGEYYRQCYWKYNGDGSVVIEENLGSGDEYLWALMGNVIDGYKIYNKAAGASYTLHKGGNGNSVISDMTTEGADNVFDIFAGASANTVAFRLRKDGETAYLNPQNNSGTWVLKGWNQIDGGGSWDFSESFFVRLNASGIDGVGKLATFSASVATAVPEGTTAYFATVGDEYISMTALPEGKAIPANTGVIIESESSNVTMLATSTEVADASTNALQHTADGAKTYDELPANSYMLAGSSGKAAFCKILSGSLGANKAYIVIDGGAPAAVRMLFGDIETGIEGLPAEQDTDAPMYDLSGRRVLNPTKGGIYLSKGKKFIVK